MVPESSLAKDFVVHVLSNIDNSMKSDVPTVFAVLAVWAAPESFGDEGRGRRHHLPLGLPVWDSQLHHNPQTPPVSHHQPSSETEPGADLGGHMAWSLPGPGCTAGSPQVDNREAGGSA